jgi:NAD(P)-dependent dehydrogenase (short-subunit alcohol dehydrogenase family)
MTRSKIILITGATSGIGRAAALQLSSRGHRVFATGRNEAALETLAREGLETLRLDVTDPASIRDAVAHIDGVTGGHGVDVLINNAGYGVVAPTIEIDEADLRGQFETNVFGLLAVTRAFTERMRERGTGRVVNIGSVGGKVTLPLMAPYNATKYALESLSDGLRLELQPLGIDVVLIEPGVIATNFNGQATHGLDRYRDTDSVFAGPLTRMHEMMARTESLAASPERVARVITKVAEQRRPRARYVVPRRTFAMLWMSRVLPTRWFDGILRSFFGLRAAKMRAIEPVRLTEVPAK